MRKITQFSVNYPVTVFMLVLGILLLGYISFEKLGIDLLPDLNSPRLYVEISAGEKPPEEIETQFVRDIEAMVSRLQKVTEVSSITKVGIGKVTVEYAWNADMDEAFLDLQKALSSYSQNSELDELNISQQDPNARPVMVLALSRPEADMVQLQQVAENYLENELIRLEGIASVDLIGGEEKEVVVETSPYLLEAYGLTATQVAAKIAAFNRDISSGSLVEMGLKYIIKGVSKYQNLEDIRNIIISYQSPTTAGGTVTASRGGAEKIPVRLRDISKVSIASKDPENIVHVNQTRCMGLAVYKETRFNTVQAARQIEDNLERLKKSLPDYDLTVISNQADFINDSISEVEETALIGILLAVLVLFIFLRRVGVTFVISIAIPISIVATFNLMYFNGLTLNIMTLGGLALGAGMLVDNAIVVMENIFRLMEQGKSLKEAAIEGTAQVGGAITAATLTTIVVFLPIVYLHGAAGELFRDQAWTVAFALLSSLFVAILVIPMLSTRWLKKSTKPHKQTLEFKAYGRWLTAALDRKGLVIGVVAVLAIFSLILLPLVGSEFLPETDQGEFSIEIKLPEGTDLDHTEGAVTNIEHLVVAAGGTDVHTMYSEIGPSSSTTVEASDFFEGENTATITVVLISDRQKSTAEIMTQIRRELSNIPEMDVQVIPAQTALQLTMGQTGAPLSVEIKGDDLAELERLTQKTAAILAEDPSLSGITTSFDMGRPEVNISIDPLLSAAWNLNPDDIASQLEALLVGKEATQWETGGELTDITLKFPHISLMEIGNIPIQVSGDQKIQLGQIARISQDTAPGQVLHRNQNRIGQIQAQIDRSRPLDKTVKAVRDKLEQMDWPAEYGYQIGGEELQRKAAFGNLKFAMLLALVLVYMVLASQFESLLHPFIILLTVPLAATGSIFLFLLLGQSFNIMSYIGMIMLAGIAVNDSIILVDAINQLRRQGNPVNAAIIEAAQKRIRPIVMTSLTTILALLPLTFGIGASAALRSPMALAVIGGLISSTLLALFFIPVVYALMEKIRPRRD